MISNIVSSHPECIKVSSVPTPDISGAVYWDASIRQYKIVNQQGISHPVGYCPVDISIGSKIEEMLVWFNKKLVEEYQIQELCKKYPNLAEAKREYDTLVSLLKDR